MDNKERVAIIISASSDIGVAMCRRWIKNGFRVFGTYRTKSAETDELENRGVKLVPCDLPDSDSIINACSSLHQLCSQWDLLVIAPATQEPIGAFIGVYPDFSTRF